MGLDDTDSEDELPYHQDNKSDVGTRRKEEDKGVKGELKEE